MPDPTPFTPAPIDGNSDAPPGPAAEGCSPGAGYRRAQAVGDYGRSDERYPAPTIRESCRLFGRRIAPLARPKGPKGGAMMSGSDSIEDLAVVFASECLDIEARLVAAGWHDPVLLLEEASRAHLFGKDFADPLVGLIFDLLLISADAGRPLTHATVREVAAREHIQIPDAAFPDDITRICNLEIVSAGIPNYTRLVADFVRRRAEAKEHLRKAAELLAPFPSKVQRAVAQAAIRKQRRRARDRDNTQPRTQRRIVA